MSKIGIIILAAGKGTRMNSEKPKVCFELAGKSLIQRVVETSLELNPDLIGIVVGYKKEMVIEEIHKLQIKKSTSHVASGVGGEGGRHSISPPHVACGVGGEGGGIIYFLTQENQLGTGDAVKCTGGLFKEYSGTVFVLCGDVPLLKKQTLLDMQNSHLNGNAKCTVLTMVLDDPDKYGRIVRDEAGNIKGIVEFKDATDEIKRIKEVNTGIYCFDSVELFQALEKIDNNNAQGEYYLTDVLKIIYEDSKKIESVILKDITEAQGVNSQIQLEELERELRIKN